MQPKEELSITIIFIPCAQCVKINPYLNCDQYGNSNILKFGFIFTHKHDKNMTFKHSSSLTEVQEATLY